MSWHFSRALVEEYLAGNSSDGRLAALLRSTPSEKAYCSHGKTNVSSLSSQFGMTCPRLTAIHGEELLKWYREVFLAPTLPPAVQVPESSEPVPASPSKCSESLVKFDLQSDSLKTLHCSLAVDSNTSFFIWPNWGTMRNGECWEQTKPAHLTDEKGRGLWHPTPTKMDKKGATTFTMMQAEKKRSAYLRYWLHRRSPTHSTTYPHPTFLEMVMGWPIGWTRFQPVETAKFQQWLNSHGKPSDPDPAA